MNLDLHKATAPIMPQFFRLRATFVDNNVSNSGTTNIMSIYQMLTNRFDAMNWGTINYIDRLYELNNI